MLQWIKNLFRLPQLIGPPKLIKRFDGSEAILTKEGVSLSGDTWFIDVAESQTIKMFEINMTDIDNCILTYRASLKSEDVQGQSFLEMWCRIPARGEFFLKGF